MKKRSRTKSFSEKLQYEHNNRVRGYYTVSFDGKVLKSDVTVFFLSSIRSF